MAIIDEASVGMDLTGVIASSDPRAILRYLRIHKLRKPELVLKYGVEVLNSVAQAKLGINGVSDAEFLAVIEQTLLAALDLSNKKLAEQCLVALKSKYPPESARVRRLLGLCLECDGDFDGALSLYDQLLTTNPSSEFARKRKYCILRGQTGKEVAARNALNEYLERFPGDVGAWKEMGRSCLDVGDYDGAIFCWEELVLSQPLDSTLHCELGELYATLGGVKNLLRARKHLAQALDLDPEYSRALFSLFGVVSSHMELVVIGKGESKAHFEEHDFEVAKALFKFCFRKVSNRWKGSKHSRTSKAMMKVLEDYEHLFKQITDSIS